MLPVHHLLEELNAGYDLAFTSSLIFYSTLYLNLTDLYIGLLLVSLYYYLCYISHQQTIYQPDDIIENSRDESRLVSG